MNACDPASVPSRNEPFEILMLYAWCAAKPVIATDAVHLIDNFSNGVTGTEIRSPSHSASNTRWVISI